MSSPALAQEALTGSDTTTVLFDFGHHNVGAGRNASSNLFPVLENEGYEVETLSSAFTREALIGIDIVVIAAPLADRNALRLSPDTDVNAEVARRWRKPVPSAFTPGEIDLLQTWVQTGGSLLVVVDHFPMPGAVGPLLSRFGIETSNGFAVDSSRLPPLPANEGGPLGTAGELVFDRGTRTLAAHPVTDGRNDSERIEVIGTFVGSAFRLPENGEPLLTFGAESVSLLPEVAWEFSEATPRQSIAGWSQGGLVRVGRGRVAVFGELAMMATPSAMNETHPEMQNGQLLLNVFRWLSDVRE